jgi:hypothetical protein
VSADQGDPILGATEMDKAVTLLAAFRQALDFRAAHAGRGGQCFDEPGGDFAAVAVGARLKQQLANAPEVAQREGQTVTEFDPLRVG